MNFKLLFAVLAILLIAYLIVDITEVEFEEGYIEVIYKRRQGGEEVLIVNNLTSKGELVEANMIYILDNAMAHDIIEMGDTYMIQYATRHDKRYIEDMKIKVFHE